MGCMRLIVSRSVVLITFSSLFYLYFSSFCSPFFYSKQKNGFAVLKEVFSVVFKTLVAAVIRL